MHNLLPETCFTVIEAAKVQSEVYLKSKSDKAYNSIATNYNIHKNWWFETEKVFKQSSGISTKTGYASLILLSRESSGFDVYNYCYLSSPVSFKSFDTWALFQSVKDAEIKFLEICSKPNNEVSLTSALIQIMNSKSEVIQEKYKKNLSITGAEINCKKLELQIQNRERDTGGDFALLLEWKKPGGKLCICPIIFQAKRITNLYGDISQYNNNAGYQFDVLSRSKCNPVYIFYNCDSCNITSEPRLPTVKKVSDILIENEPKKTSSVEKVLSLSTFLLDVITSTKYYVTNTRREALNEILIDVSELELSNVITFSVDPNALREYEKEYQEFITQNSLENDKEYDNDFDFSP